MAVTRERAKTTKSERMSPKRTETFNLRTTTQNKEVIKQAASLSGLTMSQFVMRASLDAAYDLLQNRHHTTLSQRDWQTLLDAAGKQASPTSAMQALAADFKRKKAAQ